MAFVSRFDIAEIGKIVIPAIAHTLEDLDYISEDTTQVTVVYSAIAVAHSAYIDARVLDSATFSLIVYSVDKDSGISYSKVFQAQAVSRSTDTVLLDIV